MVFEAPYKTHHMKFILLIPTLLAVWTMIDYSQKINFTIMQNVRHLFKTSLWSFGNDVISIFPVVQLIGKYYYAPLNTQIFIISHSIAIV